MDSRIIICSKIKMLKFSETLQVIPLMPAIILVNIYSDILILMFIHKFLLNFQKL